MRKIFNFLKFRYLILIFFIIILPINSSAEILFGEDYYQTLHKHLQEAESSITIAMYFIIIDPEDSSNPINSLVEDLIRAKDRGVRVKIVLEDSKLKENRFAYEKLKENGVDVYFDTPRYLLHIKGVAIDDKFVFIGSANWSKSAIQDNYEATYFKDLPEDASDFRKYVDNIPIQKGDIFLPQEEGVILSSDFLLSTEGGRILLKEQAYKQLDLYLLLCKIAKEKEKSSIDINYDSLAKEMGYKAPDDLGKYRSIHNYYYERIHRLLVPLKKDGFIDYKKGKVVLKIKFIEPTDGDYFKIPLEYWEYGYPGKLSMRAKYMYLISLYEANRSTKYPFWFRSQEDMSKLYGISDTTISLGFMELEDKGIIKIKRDRPTPPDYSDRKANVYRVVPLN